MPYIFCTEHLEKVVSRYDISLCIWNVMLETSFIFCWFIFRIRKSTWNGSLRRGGGVKSKQLPEMFNHSCGTAIGLDP